MAIIRKLSPALWARLLAISEDEVSRVLHAIPEALRSAAEAVTLVYENFPNVALVKEGIEFDTLGLFIGEAFADGEKSLNLVPPEIVLYLANIWDLVEQDEEFFRDEVRATYLHELGHYLGLDEEDLIDRGLE
jgi:predicted Zn-dependent protease with MMP-like domain